MGASSRTCILFVTIHMIAVMTAQEMEKRGPQGFLGMRGKKFDSTEQFYKRKPQFFVGVKGKKTIYDYMAPEGAYKRAPMGFMGMRGKKDFDEYNPEGYEYSPKTGSLIGQIDYTSSDINNEFPILNEVLREYLNKLEHPEPSSMPESIESGDEERFGNDIDKRAASVHQFFGVRGKKSMEKRLADVSFRGKFIGVRGKKNMPYMPGKEIRVLLDNSPPKRKGFIGMRGKKWTDDSSREMDASN